MVWGSFRTLAITANSLTHLADLAVPLPSLTAHSRESPSSGEEGGERPNGLFSQGQRSWEDPGVQREKNRWEQREKEKVREGQHQEKGNIARGTLVGHQCGASLRVGVWGGGAR